MVDTLSLQERLTVISQAEDALKEHNLILAVSHLHILKANVLAEIEEKL